ncbi:hypothetical protein DBR11_19610 [Pedobacter sp. HMWF019]|uniref:hypothetical protein n=1 Tax=Pedobacter sp. HMWF019 TaxID=2056856 RepID=UPI000D399845|nr:hypothetical protein [Pedobacter sp. HMWF019]PTS96184.1 hypothetical protein DBR11_19610 [Pedobacter sp. HMWF019]
MKNKQLYILLLIILLPVFTYAQKAYEAVPYSGMMNKKPVKLSFADGYIGASSITLTNSKNGRKIIFSPDAGYVGEDKKLKFHRSSPSPVLSSDYFTLINLTEYYDTLPKSINGIYYNKGKIYKIRFFKQ